MAQEDRQLIYFDQSATSVHKPPEVAEAVALGLRGGYGNPSRGAHDPALHALQEVAKARRAVAAYFGASPLEVAFTFNATMALNMAIKGALTTGDCVLTTPYSHNAMLRPLYEMQDRGMRLDIMPLDQQGGCTLAGIMQHIRPDTTALALNPMSNVTGDTVLLAEIIALCRQRDLLLILDMAQWAGTRPMPHIDNWPRTLIAFTGHKSLYGPQGIGGLINLGQVPLSPIITGGSGTHSFDRQHPGVFPDVCEAGTPNVPGLMGLRAGLQWLTETGPDAVQQRLAMLRGRFVAGLAQIPQVKVYGGEQADAGPVVSINLGDMPSSSLSDALYQKHGIATRSGAHCAPLMHRALGTVQQGTVRFSFSYFNCIEEVDCALEALDALSTQ